MTSKQVYAALAKIAGHKCHDGKKFVRASRIGEEHRKIIQNRILVLLQKLDYGRCVNDFRECFTEERERPSSHELILSQAEHYRLMATLTASPFVAAADSTPLIRGTAGDGQGSWVPLPDWQEPRDR